MRRFKELLTLNKTPSSTPSSLSVTEAEANKFTEKGLRFNLYI